MTNVLFRTDAGPKIGLGHLQRSLSLANAFEKMGVRSLFLTNGDQSNLLRIKSHGFPVNSSVISESWSPDDIKTTLDVAAENECDAVLVDCRFAHAEYLAELAKTAYVIARDDMASHSFSCQMVFNGNADASRLPYCSSSGNTVFLLGLDYMVLRSEFEDQFSRPFRRGVQNILVTVGGTDLYGLMAPILTMLDSLPGDFSVTAVVGPYFDNIPAVTAAAEDANRSINLVHDPESIRELMLKADLAVSAAGQTLYELACVGCPTVAFQTAPDQPGQLAALAEAGSLIAAGNAQEHDMVAAIGDAILSLLQDNGIRSGIAAQAQRLVDGKGAWRVAEAIANAVSGSQEEHSQ